MLSGNKWYKLLTTLRELSQSSLPPQVFSFGGFWSNHLHALAFASHHLKFPATGFVRGHPNQALSNTLKDALTWGMTLEFLSREDYRRRYEPQWCLMQAQQSLRARGIMVETSEIRIVPEGGSDTAALEGLALWAGQIESISPQGGTLVLPVGSGGTLAGLRRALSPDWAVIGIPVVKEGESLEHRILSLMAGKSPGPWQLWRGFEGPGFGKLTPSLSEAILALEARCHVPLDPVYTGKMMLAVDAGFESGRLTGPVWVLHTGGLQGRRGFGWPEYGEIQPTIGYS
jgi:1-aminocyclopropane-1-carboxylate deaminase